MGLLGPQPGEQRRQGSVLYPGEPSEQLIGQAVRVGRHSARGTAEGVAHYPQTIHGGQVVVAAQLGQAPAGQAYSDPVVAREERSGILGPTATAQMTDEMVKQVAVVSHPPCRVSSGLTGKGGREPGPSHLRGCTSYVGDTPSIGVHQSGVDLRQALPGVGRVGAEPQERDVILQVVQPVAAFADGLQQGPGQESADPVAGVEVVLVEGLPQRRDRRFRDAALPGEHGQFGPALLVSGVKVVNGDLDSPQQGGVLVVVGELVRDLVQLAFAEPAQQARPCLRAPVAGDGPDHRHPQCQVPHQ